MICTVDIPAVSSPLSAREHHSYRHVSSGNVCTHVPPRAVYWHIRGLHEDNGIAIVNVAVAAAEVLAAASKNAAARARSRVRVL